MIQDSNRKLFGMCEGLVVQQPVHHDHVCLFFICSGRVRVGLPDRFGKDLFLPLNLTSRLALW